MNWKSLLYPLFPSWGKKLHGKRRKGLWYRHVPTRVLECQTEQDRIFWSCFLHPQKGGWFLEVGGDGIVGSQTLGLERQHYWRGVVQVQDNRAQKRVQMIRECQVSGPLEGFSWGNRIDLLALHQPKEFPDIWKAVAEKKIRPRWIVVENPEPDTQWCRRLKPQGYRLRFFFHDDEFYEQRS